MKTGMKVALLSFLCVMAQGNDVNATVSSVDSNEQPGKVILGQNVEVLDEQGKESIERFVKISKERNKFDVETLKRVKSLVQIETDYKHSKVMVEEMQEVANNPEPFIEERQRKLLDEDIALYKGLNMDTKVKTLKTMKENISSKKGMK